MMQIESVQDKACHLNEGVYAYRDDTVTKLRWKREKASLNELSSGIQGSVTETV